MNCILKYLFEKNIRNEFVKPILRIGFVDDRRERRQEPRSPAAGYLSVYNYVRERCPFVQIMSVNDNVRKISVHLSMGFIKALVILVWSMVVSKLLFLYILVKTRKDLRCTKSRVCSEHCFLASAKEPSFYLSYFSHKNTCGPHTNKSDFVRIDICDKKGGNESKKKKALILDS